MSLRLPLALLILATGCPAWGQPLFEPGPLYGTPDTGALFFAYARFDGEGHYGLFVAEAPLFGGGALRLHYFTEEDGGWVGRDVPLPRGLYTLYAFQGVDWDRDGRDDLVVGRGDGILLFRNVGAPGEVAFADGEMLVDRHSVEGHFQFADFNADGYEDLALTTYSGDYVEVALNNRGRGVIPQGPTPLASTTGFRYADDLNGDGHTDLLLQDWTDGVTVLEGDGVGGHSAAHPFPPSEMGGKPLALTRFDADGDGAEELVTLVRAGGHLALNWVDVGPGFDLDVTRTVALDTVAYQSGWVYRLEPADLLGDGRYGLVLTAVDDPLTVRRFYAEGEGGLQAVGFDRARAHTSYPFARAPSGAYYRPYSYREGSYYRRLLLDVRLAPTSIPPPNAPTALTVETGRRGEATLSWAPALQGSAPPIYQVELARADRTYRFASEYAVEGRSARGYRAPYNGTTRSSWAFRNLSAGAYQARVYAVDASGQRGARSEPVAFVVAEGPAPRAPAGLAAAAANGGISLRYRVVGLADSVVVWRQAEGAEFEPLVTLSPGSASHVDRAVVGGATYRYRVQSYLDGEASPPSETASAEAPALVIAELALPDPAYDVEKAVPYDLDGDGYEDVVVWAHDAGSTTYRLYLVPGTAGGLDASAARTLVSGGGRLITLHVGDWDGDTQADLVASACVIAEQCVEFEAHVWALEPGTLDVAAEHAAPIPPGPRGSCTIQDVADFDLDGRADLFVTCGGPSAFVGWSEPGGGVTFGRALGETYEGWASALLDYDQDGWRDVITSVRPNLAPVVFRNNGDRTFTETSVWLTDEDALFWSYQPLWLDEDEHPDLLASRRDDGGAFEGHTLYAFDPGSGTYAAHPLGSFEGASVVRPVHLDADGYTDFIEFIQGSQSPHRIRFWWNEANESLHYTEYALGNGGPDGSGLTGLFNLDADGDGDLDAVYTLLGRGSLFVIPGTAGPVPPPTRPAGLAVAGDADALEVMWAEAASGWALPGHVAYGLVLASAADTLVVGSVSPYTGIPHAAVDAGRPHGTRLVLRDLAPGAYTLRVAAVDPAGRASGLSDPLAFQLTSVGVETGGAVVADALGPVRPNPSRGAASVTLTLARARSHVEVSLLDVLGRRVARLHAGSLQAGPSAFSLAGLDLPAGAYVVRAVGEGLQLVRPLTLIR